MSFISFDFIIFFFLLFLFYILLGFRAQNRLLLIGSYIFYGWWDYRFLSLIVISSTIDYYCALNADPNKEPLLSKFRRKVFVIISIIANLSILGFFKYYNFFIDSALVLLNHFGISGEWLHLDIVLPVGISFYTFQTMSYTIDVYRGKLASTNLYLDFLLYVSFFPQLVAGPIERGTHLLPQILAPRTVTMDKVASGFRLAFWGFFKKMVIADNLSVLVNNTFSDASPSGASIIIAVYAFAFQIYCDFSGYTDIARGIARIMGFDIIVNFRLPYFAINPSDFWERWHISLSSWLRDYLYIPLGGNRGNLFHTNVNLLLTMLLGGLWHGASWHFVMWGAFHGILLIIYRPLRRRKKGTARKQSQGKSFLFWIKVALFFQLTCIGWLIFRVEDMTQMTNFCAAILTDISLVDFFCIPALQVIILAVPLFVFQIYQFISGDMEPWNHWPWYVKIPFYLLLFYSIVLLGEPVEEAFIYFQF